MRGGSSIDDADALAHQARLVADVLEVIAAAEAPALPAFGPGGREPVGALPAVALSEDRATRVELVVAIANFRTKPNSAPSVNRVDAFQ